MSEENLCPPGKHSIGCCKQPSKCTAMKSKKHEEMMHQRNSAEVIYMMPNFQPSPSDQDMFFDCQESDSEQQRKCEQQLEAQQQQQRGEKKPDDEKKCNEIAKAQTVAVESDLRDPTALRTALERVMNATQMLLKNFDAISAPMAGNSLEITLRLIDDSSDSKEDQGPRGGKPVTIKLPIEDQMGDAGTTATATLFTTPAAAPCTPGAHAGAAAYAATDATDADGGLQPTDGKKINCKGIYSVPTTTFDDRACVCTMPKCLMSCPNNYETREVISIQIVPRPNNKIEHVHVWGEPDKIESVEKAEIKSVVKSEEKSEVKSEVSVRHPELKKSSSTFIEEVKFEQKPAKRYYMALPQHKEFTSCSPCRYDPSPIMDEEGNIFCPGNCGCCQCPWKKRCFAQNHDHQTLKVCRCTQRGTIFVDFNEREVCSQASGFDFCPCRERAEAKFLLLHSVEMWSSPNVLRGREIRMEEIVELAKPPLQY